MNPWELQACSEIFHSILFFEKWAIILKPSTAAVSILKGNTLELVALKIEGEKQIERDGINLGELS